MKNKTLKGGLNELKSNAGQTVSLSREVVKESLPQGAAGPLILQPAIPGVDLSGWVKEKKTQLAAQLKQYGGILFRGFDINTVERFKALIEQLELDSLKYTMRSSPRYEVSEKIYHTTTHPADQMINMHSESSYAATWPLKVLFCCITPAAEQGETPVADTRKVLEYISPRTQQLFEEKGVMYMRCLSDQLGLPWREVFQTDDPKVVEASCQKNNMEYEWGEDSKLLIRWKKKAIYRHPFTGERTWFNHAFFFNKYTLQPDMLSLMGDDNLPFNTAFGDGTEIPAEIFEELKNAYQQALVVFPWEKGDVLFLDNMLMAHGRMPYKGERQILASLLEPVDDQLLQEL